MLLSPIEEGGQGLLNFEDWNDAIEIMKLQSYLKTTNRPTWAAIYDQYIYRNRTTDSKKSIHMLEAGRHFFTQKWKINLRAPMPEQIKSMIHIKKKYGVTFEELLPTREIKESLPIWDHFALQKKLRKQKDVDRCLQENHKVIRVGDAVALTSRTSP